MKERVAKEKRLERKVRRNEEALTKSEKRTLFDLPMKTVNTREKIKECVDRSEQNEDAPWVYFRSALGNPEASTNFANHSSIFTLFSQLMTDTFFPLSSCSTADPLV